MSLGDTIRGLVGSRSPDTEPAAPGVGSSEANPDVAALAAEVKTGSRASGRRRSKRDPDAELARMQAQESIEELYAAENWEEVGALYFETRYALTGFDAFRLSDKQKKIIATSLATTMKTLVELDPKWIALTIFTVNFGGIVAQKEFQYAAHMKQIAAAKKPIPPPAS